MPTNYEKHFGDPLRAAETILGAFRHSAANCVFEMFYEIFGYRPCTGCPFYKDGHCRNNEVETIVGWLESEAAE